ncbi:Acetylxylan esterase precursor [Tsuneonella dongtanensis]|uniref:Acetylxylan esterase n=1 Tax=Tsuneonella dongtanensis TaxID=692370 RepID=A0A1B2A983_9SPHN|nr:alpha/beta hydrolase [Tsuneonella dongtanensis]ANY18615.1 Acetylxylan esterase precursor [Tsuneonella dongtanensis]
MKASRRSVIGGTVALALGSMPGAAFAHELEEIPLWPGSPPGRGGPKGPEKIGKEGAGYGAISNISVPRMRVYRPAKPNGRAVVICGGGGYFRIQEWKESAPAARWLQNRGYTVFDLLYRLPGDGWEASAPFADAQRAIRIIRSRAAEFDILPNRIGIMGFSAGGHLAGFSALQPDRVLYAGNDRFEAASARPDFAVLLFPVVSLRKPFDTTRTRREIVGDKATAEAEAAWSLDTYAAKGAPPMILFSSADDQTTPPGHNFTLFEALRKAGASVELHVYADGGHGWGLGTPQQTLNQWPEQFEAWINRAAFKS